MISMKIIKQRFEAAKKNRSKSETYIDTAFRYTVPQRRVYMEADNKHRTNPEIYDSTAVLGVQRFSTRLQSMLVPTSQNWMRLINGSANQDNDEKSVELDAATEIFHKQIQLSNFDTQVTEAFQDLAITTGALLIQPAPIGSISAVTFKAVPIAELYIEDNYDGSIKTVFREFDMRLDLVESNYPGATLSNKHKELLKRDPNTKVTIIEACIYLPKEDLYEVSVIDAKEDHYFLNKVEETSPWVVFRENVVPGVALGFGRVMRVLPDIKTVNQVKRDVLRGMAIAVSGTFTAHDDGVLNPYNVRLRAGAVIPVASNDSRNPSIARLDTPTRFDVADMEIAQLQATINDALLANPFGNIEDTPVRTATEIAARNRDLFDTVSSSFGRLQTEFVAPVIKRTLAVLQAAGKIDPDIVLDGVNTTYEFVSPLTRLQQSADIENVLEWLSIVGTMGQEVTELTVKMEEIPGWLAKKYSIPQELLRSQEEQKQVAADTIAANMQGLEGMVPTQQDPAMVQTGTGVEGIYG